MLTVAGVGSALLLGAAGLVEQGFLLRDWLYFIFLCAGTVAGGRLVRQAAGLPWLALVAAAFAMAADDWTTGELALVGALALVVFTVGGFAALWGTSRPIAWAALAAAAPPLLVVTAHLHASASAPALAWGGIAVGVALLLCGATFVVHRQRERLPPGDGTRWLSGPGGPIGALVAGAALLAVLGAAFELHRHWPPIAWSALLPLLALARRRLRAGEVRDVALAVAALVVLRLLLGFDLLAHPIASWPLVNRLLAAPGLPVAALLGAAALLPRARPADRDAATALRLGAIALAIPWLLLESRHWFHSRLDARSVELGEWGVWVALLAGFAAALLAFDAHRVARSADAPADSDSAAGPAGSRSARWGGRAVAGLAVGLLWLGPILAASPIFTGEDVGSRRLLNWLVVAFLLPALALLLVVRFLPRGNRLAAVARGTSLVATFLFVTFEVRQWFRGADLRAGDASAGEQWTTSAAWALLGLALLVAGIRRASALLRRAALLVIGLVVVKVFLVDLSRLEDLWRVLSFLGLGASLLLLGYLYQRFVFRR